jgi:predicted HTH domain antitoxin
MAEKLVIELDMPSVALPADLLADKQALREALAGALYRQRRISMGQVIELMGISRREFEDRLSELGLSMMDERDFEAEFHAVETLRSRQ